MVGQRKDSRALNTRCPTPIQSRHICTEDSWENNVMSAPTQNTFCPAVRTRATRACEASISATARSRSSSIVGVKAFSFVARSTSMVAT